MALRIRPADRSFYAELVDLARQLDVGATLLAEVLDSEADREDIARRMSDAESEADQITRAIVVRSRKSPNPPLSREDLYELATELDAVMDKMDEAADMIWLYEVGELPKEFARQVQIVQRCAELTLDAMTRLGDPDLDEYWMELARLETAGDKQYRRILAKLFDGRYKPLEVIKLKDIITALEAAIDGFKEASKTVELAIAKRR